MVKGSARPRVVVIQRRKLLSLRVMVVVMMGHLKTSRGFIVVECVNQQVVKSIQILKYVCYQNKPVIRYAVVVSMSS